MEMVVVDTFVNRLRTALNNVGMSQADLSRATGISTTRITRYLQGKYEPKQTGIMAIAKALNVSEVWLMGFDVEPTRIVTKEFILSGSEISMIEAFRSLNDSGKDMIIKLLSDFASLPQYKAN